MIKVSKAFLKELNFVLFTKIVEYSRNEIAEREYSVLIDGIEFTFRINKPEVNKPLTLIRTCEKE